MTNKIIIRRQGYFLKSLPDDFSVIREWVRSNSPNPSYPEWARQLTFERIPVGATSKPFDLNTNQVNWDEYANNAVKS